MIYELREYIASEGKVDELNNRFKEYTLSLFKKHHIKVKGFWTDREDASRIIYLCQFNSLEEQKAAWAAFASDSDWKKVKEESEANGPLTVSMSSVLLNPVDYTPQP